MSNKQSRSELVQIGALSQFATLVRSTKQLAVICGGLLWLCLAGQSYAADEPTAVAAPPAAVSVAPTGQAVADGRPMVPTGVPSSDAGSQYIIGPGDAIQIFVWRNPELTVSVPVRPDGRVSSPLVDDMVAVGKTPSQLARDIEVRLADFIRSPQVSIIVNNAASTFSQIKVIGQVKGPKSLPFNEGMTVMDAVLMVGGLTDFAAGNKTKIIRKDDKGKEITIKVRVEDLLTKGKVSENRPLKPGDVIIVPESLF